MISTHEPDNGGAQAVFALLKQWCDGLLAHQIPEAAGAPGGRFSARPALGARAPTRSIRCRVWPRPQGRTDIAWRPRPSNGPEQVSKPRGRELFQRHQCHLAGYHRILSHRPGGGAALTTDRVSARRPGPGGRRGRPGRWTLHRYIDTAQANINYPITCAAAMAGLPGEGKRWTAGRGNWLTGRSVI